MIFIRFFYNIWQIICVVSVLMSIASCISVLKKNKSKRYNNFFQGILVTLFITISVVSALIGNLYIRVPDVTRFMSVDNAFQTLTGLGLKVQLVEGKVMTDTTNTIVTYQSIKEELVLKGTSILIDFTEGVITDEDAENQIDINSEISNVSTGDKGLVKVPLLFGKEEAEGLRQLEESGLKGLFYWTGDGDLGYENNYIIAQSIPAGSFVELGTEVQIELVPYTPIDEKSIVPNVVGLEQVEATEILRRNGLLFSVWWTMEDWEMPAEKYYVKAQSIPGGSTVSFGTTIELELKPLLP